MFPLGDLSFQQVGGTLFLRREILAGNHAKDQMGVLGTTGCEKHGGKEAVIEALSPFP